MAKALGVDPVKINWVQAKPDDRDQLLATSRADLVFSYPLPPAPGGQVDVAGPYFLGHADLVLAGMAAQTHYRGRLRIINRGVTDQRRASVSRRERRLASSRSTPRFGSTSLTDPGARHWSRRSARPASPSPPHPLPGRPDAVEPASINGLGWGAAYREDCPAGWEIGQIRSALLPLEDRFSPRSRFRTMRLLPRPHARIVIALLTVLLLVTTSCAAPQSAERFSSLATRNLQLSFSPLASPEEALSKSDVIFTGRPQRVIEGPEIIASNPAETQRLQGMYVFLVVSDLQPVAGLRSLLAGGEAYVLVQIGETTAGILDRALPDGLMIGVVRENSDWQPVPGATLKRPAEMPKDAPILRPFVDGIWIQGVADTQMYGMTSALSDLGPRWGRPRSIEDYVQRVRQAKSQ